MRQWEGRNSPPDDRGCVSSRLPLTSLRRRFGLVPSEFFAGLRVMVPIPAVRKKNNFTWVVFIWLRVIGEVVLALGLQIYVTGVVFSEGVRICVAGIVFSEGVRICLAGIVFSAGVQICLAGIGFSAGVQICVAGIVFGAGVRICVAGIDFRAGVHICVAGVVFSAGVQICVAGVDFSELGKIRGGWGGVCVVGWRKKRIGLSFRLRFSVDESFWWPFSG